MLSLWPKARSTPTVIAMQHATSLKLTPAALADLWHEIAVYLKICDLLYKNGFEGHLAP